MSMNLLAAGYFDLGRNAEALKLNEETLALTEGEARARPPRHVCQHEQPRQQLRSRGPARPGAEAPRGDPGARKAKLGPDHPDTLASMHNLAWSYNGAGQHDRATKLFEETLALMKAKLGPDHPDTLICMYSLAISYAAAGQYDRAIKLHEETLALRKAKLGPDHPDTLEHEQPRHQLCRRRPERPGAEAPRGDPGAAEGEARPRPPRHAHEHEQPRRQLHSTPARTTGR